MGILVVTMRFASAMESRTDDELRGILKEPADAWEPEAIEAARAEIERRGLTSAANPYRTANGQEGPLEDPAPSPSPMNLKVFLFGVFFTLLGVLVVYGVSAGWKRNGEARKAAAWRRSVLGGAVTGFLVMIGLRACH